jgi:hypothetical protein
MRDVILVLVMVGFFAVAAAYVRACGLIIGPDAIASSDVEGVPLSSATDARSAPR